MIDAPRTDTMPDQLVARVHLTIPRSEIRSVLGPGLAEVKDTVQAQGVGAGGPWFTHHLRMHPSKFDFEICVPVIAPVAPNGRVEPGRIPAIKVARTIYEGGYEGLHKAWSEFSAWISENGHVPCQDLFEYYLVGPDSSPKPANWRTELIQPLAD